MDERNSNPNLRLHRDDGPEDDLVLPPKLVAELRREFGHAEAEAPAWLTVAMATEFERHRTTKAGRRGAMKFALIAACVAIAVAVGMRVQKAGTPSADKNVTSDTKASELRTLAMQPETYGAASGGTAAARKPGGPVSTSLVRLKSNDLADVNHDGKVDILDAMKLAKTIQASTSLRLAADMQNDRQTLDVSWDLNGDGKVDQADVDALAALAVEGGAS